MDFSKAFDSVPHQRLLRKLHNVESRVKPWSGLILSSPTVTNKSWLKAKPPTSVKLHRESRKEQSSGQTYPQRFTPDFSPMTVYSVSEHKKHTRDTEILQDDLDTLVKWEWDWQMSFNASKCFQMRITHKRKPIQVNYRLGNTTLEEVKQ